MSLITEQVDDIDTWNKTTNASGVFLVGSQWKIKLSKKQIPKIDNWKWLYEK